MERLVSRLLRTWKIQAEQRLAAAECEVAERVDDRLEEGDCEADSEGVATTFEDMDGQPLWEASRPPDDGRLSVYNGKRDRRGRQSRHGARKPRGKNVRRTKRHDKCA